MIEKFLTYFSLNGRIDFWSQEIFGNSVKDYFEAILMFLVFLIIFKIFQSLILYRLNKIAQKTKTDIDDTFIKIVKTLRPPFYSFLAFYFAIKFLATEGSADKIISLILTVWVIYQGVIAVQILIDYILRKNIKDKEDAHAKSAMKLLGNILKGVLWGIAILLFLSNLGVDITSLIAGLGIGGIAVALALQNVLGDLFSSFAIYFDKPFAVGDVIMIGADMGEVKKIGIKTTRIKTLRGEELIVSNKELTSVRVQNFERMQERRVVFNFGIVYQTSADKVKKISEMVKKIIEEVKMARFDRAHFNQFGDSALIFEVVYYVDSAEYMDYANANQEILLKLKETFEREGIEFAYPTQTIFLEK